jgi:hypothetical protein
MTIEQRWISLRSGSIGRLGEARNALERGISNLDLGVAPAFTSLEDIGSNMQSSAHRPGAITMPDESKPSTLADQIKSAQESIRSWPAWLRNSAKFSGQPGPNESRADRQIDRADQSGATK